MDSWQYEIAQSTHMPDYIFVYCLVLVSRMRREVHVRIFEGVSLWNVSYL